ncbi:unnamed protein product [Effrenium voratum]|nr:unnamed protein product [Effrenium voratum]
MSILIVKALRPWLKSNSPCKARADSAMPRRAEVAVQKKSKRRLKKHVKATKKTKPRRRRIMKKRSAAAVEAKDQGSGHDCPICHEAYSATVFPVVQAPCGHVACASCCLQWQQKKPARTCALCRAPVLSVAHCALLEQLIDKRPASGVDDDPSRSELKQALRDLSRGDLNHIPGDYRTDAIKAAAYRAIRKGDLAMLKSCIVDFKVRASTKLLCEVAENWRGDIGVISLLTDNGARLNGHREERPLVCAAYAGNTAILRSLLDIKADALKPIGDSGECALHLAVRYGRFESVRVLLDHGVPADIPDLEGRTPLTLAERGLAMHVNSCGMQPCNRCENRIQIRGELRWRLGKPSGSASASLAPSPPDDTESEARTWRTTIRTTPAICAISTKVKKEKKKWKRRMILTGDGCACHVFNVFVYMGDGAESTCTVWHAQVERHPDLRHAMHLRRCAL